MHYFDKVSAGQTFTIGNGCFIEFEEHVPIILSCSNDDCGILPANCDALRTFGLRSADNLAKARTRITERPRSAGRKSLASTILDPHDKTLMQGPSGRNR